MDNIQGSLFGKMFPEHSAATKARTFEPSSKRSQTSVETTYLFLDLRKTSGVSGGMVVDGWSLAWRVYDAQYWGVPQRRKRIYLVADFASERAPEILFECKSMSGDFEESREKRKSFTHDVEGSLGRSSGVECVVPQECYPINTMVATRGGKDDMRTCFGVGEPDDPQFTISAAHEHAVCYALKGNYIDRDTKQNGVGWRDGVMYTLDATDRHAIALDCRNLVAIPELSSTLQAKSNGGQSLKYQNPVVYDARGNCDGDISPTLTGDHQNRITDYTAICVGNGQLHQTDMGDKTGALNCMHDQQAIIHKSDPPRKYIIRRLTPLECCRLQGFPDWWEDGVDGSDTARYKMWGNGIALPCAVDVLGRIAKANRKG